MDDDLSTGKIGLCAVLFACGAVAAATGFALTMAWAIPILGELPRWVLGPGLLIVGVAALCGGNRLYRSTVHGR